MHGVKRPPNHLASRIRFISVMFPGDASARYARRTTGVSMPAERLHSVARAPKFENFREIEEIMRGSYILPLCPYSLFLRILSPNFAVMRLPRDFDRTLSSTSVKIETLTYSSNIAVTFLTFPLASTSDVRKIGFLLSRAAGSCLRRKIFLKTPSSKPLVAHPAVSHMVPAKFLAGRVNSACVRLA